MIKCVYGNDKRVALSRAQVVAAWDQTKRPAPGRRRRHQHDLRTREGLAIVDRCARSAAHAKWAHRLLSRQPGSPMIERRRAERFHLVDAGVGSLRMVQDVEILQLGSTRAVVIAPGPLPRGERLLLEIPAALDAPPCTLLVRVLDNRVVMDDGSLRRQVHLKMVQAPARGWRFEAARTRRRGLVMGALLRRIPVRLVEASTAGCIFDSPSVVVDGAVGFVRMRTSIDERSEAVRIKRSSKTSNLVWPYRLAAEFLTLGPPSPDSLRGLATIMSVGSPAATYR